MMKIALLGAGHIGQTIARLLHATGDYKVTVLDKSAKYLSVLAAEGIAWIKKRKGEAAVRRLLVDAPRTILAGSLP